MLKKTITALSLLCILAACQSDDNSSPQPKPRKDIALTRAEQEMMDLGTDFASLIRFVKLRWKSPICSSLL
jgi:hypothetical protein